MGNGTSKLHKNYLATTEAEQIGLNDIDKLYAENVKENESHKFNINYLKNEVTLLKRILNSSKINELDSMSELIKKLLFDQEIMKDNLARCPRQRDLDDL